MAQIFVSHSKQDEELKYFFLKAFSGTQVKSVFEEFEEIMKTTISIDDVKRDIENSRAVFVILSHNVEKLHHTRDWVAFETGAAKNKDVWVFEPYSQYGQISVIVPSVRNYVVFGTSDAWTRYIRRIIESYDDSGTLPTALVTGGLGALIGAALSEGDQSAGAVLGGIGGAIVGAAISDKSSSRPLGQRIQCANCISVYDVHLPQGINTIRCPVCNKVIKI
jgi:uncharacterized protein YcfJ